MKKLLLLFVGITAFCSVRAQEIEDSGTPVLFVNSDRTQILRVKADSGAPKVILQSINVGTLGEVRTSHLAILASTRDGKSLLVAGVFHFFDNNDDSKDSLQGFLKLDAPFGFKPGRVPIDRSSIGGAKVLHEIPFVLEEPGFVDVRKPLPLGTLSPDEKDWYGVWAKNGAAPNSFKLYHGKFDGSSNSVHIGGLPTDNEYLPRNEYHMTNLCADNNGTMITIIVDQLHSDDQQRAKLWRWTPTNNIEPQISDFNDIEGLRLGQNLDSAFVCLLRIVPGTNEAEIGLTPEDQGDIFFYNFIYTGGSVNLGVANGRQIRWDAIPDSIYFFTGITGDPNGPGDDRETQAKNMRHVNGGDMMFSQTGDSVVFITSNALGGGGDWAATPQRSHIWIYDINSNTAKFVYNNPAKMERQPIFMGQIWKIKEPPPPPPQGSLIFSLDTLKFDSVDVGKTKALTLNVTNPSSNTVNGISLGLPTDDAFIVTSSLPDSLKGGQTLPLTVTFAPSAVGPVVGSIKATFALSEDSSRTLYMRGVGRQPASVDPEDLSGFSVRVHPNPFSGAANIDINYDGREGLEVRLVDVLGREYRVDAEGVRAQMLTKDASEQFRLDSKALKLAPGTYTLFVKNGERSISRQLIVSE